MPRRRRSPWCCWSMSFAMLVLINLLERWSKRTMHKPTPHLLPALTRRTRAAHRDPLWVQWTLIALAAVRRSAC